MASLPDLTPKRWPPGRHRSAAGDAGAMGRRRSRTPGNADEQLATGSPRLPGRRQAGCHAVRACPAFACASVGVERREAVEGFLHTRLASTVSAAMRLLPIGQPSASVALARLRSAAAGVAVERRGRAATPWSRSRRARHRVDGRTSMCIRGCSDREQACGSHRNWRTGRFGKDGAGGRAVQGMRDAISSAVSSRTTSSRARTWSFSCAARRLPRTGSSASRPAGVRTRRSARTRR